MRIAHLSLLLVTVLAAQGCAWMPDYLRPSLSLPSVTPADRTPAQEQAAPPAPSLRHGRYVLAPSHSRQQVQVETAYNWMPGEVFDKIGGFDVLAEPKAEPGLEAKSEIDPSSDTPRLAYAQNSGLEQLTESRVYFSTGSAELTASAMERLAQLSPGRYRVLGFADPRGSRARNLELSRQRAAAVARWLAQHGYATTSVVACGAALAAQNPDVFAQERRVEVLEDSEGMGAGCPAP